jgi:ABC-2 type transport system ATP-binding protein
MADFCRLELTDIEKSFAGHAVLCGVSLLLRGGECAAITGENGCGKSTLLRIAAGLLPPAKGTVSIDKSISIQYVPDSFPPIPITGVEFLGRLARVDVLRNIALVKALSMADYLSLPISAYSKGMRGKICALQALLASPELLILDEPISGQDAESRRAFITEVRRLMSAGCAVLMACHERELIDGLATSVYCLEDGKIFLTDGYKAKNNNCLCRNCPKYLSGECRGGECVNA